MNIINLDELSYGAYYFVNMYNNKVTQIYKGYVNTVITEYSVNDSGMIFANLTKFANIDISMNTVVKIDGIQADCEQFYNMQSAYYRQNERF